MKNEKYSHGFFQRQDLTKVDPEEFNGTTIVNACFAQKDPFTDCFPPDIRDVIFDNCNLDNCNIPAGNTVKGGTNKHIKEQADGEIWIVNASLEPVSPLKPYRFDAAGLSKDPAMIATQAETRIVSSTKEGLSTKLVPVTMVKELNEQIALKALLSDTERLMQIVADDLAKEG